MEDEIMLDTYDFLHSEERYEDLDQTNYDTDYSGELEFGDALNLHSRDGFDYIEGEEE